MMAQWRETEEADGGATRQPWVWERLTWTILPLGGVVGLGLLGWTMRGGAPIGAALAALLIYVTLCALIVRIDRAIKRQERVERVEGEERRRRLRRRPYSVVDEAETVLDRALGRRGTR